MPLFETPGLIGRQLSQQDLSALTEILSDPDVMKYSVHGVCDEHATRKFIDWCQECYSSYGVGSWALVEKSSGGLVGFCGVSPEMVDGIEEMNLGYRLARNFWNQGFATEAVKGVINYVCTQKSIRSVVVIIEPEHKASLRVCEKAGFSSYTNLEFHGKPVRLYRMAWRH
ncbi:MAG: GNAT family N-acetyltransferase [Pseudomonadales bacterium]